MALSSKKTSSLEILFLGIVASVFSVIAQGGGQTLGLGLVDKNRTVVYY